jgi:alpha-beta hydrolase superfamily lysophospholipase
MEATSEVFTGMGACQLNSKTWRPQGEPKAVLAIVHGAGEYIGRYQNLAAALIPKGYALCGYDQRGHGTSEGQRGHINSWGEYRGDLGIFLERVNTMFPGTVRFLLGHSMGTLVVLDYLQQPTTSVKGAILSGTALDPADAAPPAKVFVAKVLSGIIPTFPMQLPVSGDCISRDPQWVQLYNQDTLVHFARSARWGTETLGTIERIKDNPEKLQTPLLFLHGEADPLVTAEGARRFYERLPLADKTIHIYPDGLHEPLNDLNSQQVIADLESWMSAHL